MAAAVIASLAIVPHASAAKQPATDVIVRVAKAAPCPSARSALAYYQMRHSTWSELRGTSTTFRLVQPRGCAYIAWLAERWQKRAGEAREKYLAWKREQTRRTLRDFEFRPGNQAWLKAVTEVQKVYPGTSGWLLSCSAAEGGHGRWVVYGGRSYFPGAEHTYNGHLPQVGGPMQFMWGTFKGMYRRALEDVRSRGYKVPEHLRDHSDVRAWQSALAQALAAGWARYTGNDNSHWSASFGRGC